MPAPETESIPQNLTDDIEKKKQKKPKKVSIVPKAMTGFEQAFEQYATSGFKSLDGVVSNPDTQSPTDGDIPEDNKMDVSATQVRLKVDRFVLLFVTN